MPKQKKLRFKSERAQATVEYILLLSTVLAVFIVISKVLVKPLYKQGLESVKKVIENQFINSDLHYLRVP